MRDDCPPEFLPRLEIIITNANESTLREQPATYGTPSTASDGPADVIEAWQRLHAATLQDASLGRWFVKTIDLILGPK